jgi:hypothetical protein
MPIVVVRNLRRVLMTLILTGATVLTAPAAGCDTSGTKDGLANIARLDSGDYASWRTNFGSGG